ncbi:MAG: flagellar hook-length control protein FliK [Magnetococcales bacterium]|nr:flagellar hook-length control protein FliK [Magnetococcales bacterium]
MVISGTLVPPGGSTAQTTAKPTSLSVGQVMTGRVAQSSGNNQGVIRFADGSSFNYSGASLKVGEQVQVEVMRLAPELAFRLAGSDSGVAGRLALSAEQSLMRGPDIFAQLLSHAGGKAAGTSSSLQMGLQSPLLLSGKGENMAAILQRVLPNVSTTGLMKGDASGVSQLLQGGREELASAIRLLREAAADLRPAGGGKPTPEAAAELNAARTSLQRLGDMLAMQDILPRAVPSTDGEAFLGYRLFWLTEGGLGEAVWRREKARRQGGEQQEDITSVLLTLNMTNLGSVQVRIAYGEKSLLISIGAQEEAALSSLRSDIGELRGQLIQAELPLRALELSRLSGGEIKEQRLQALGIGAGFSAEV